MRNYRYTLWLTMIILIAGLASGCGQGVLGGASVNGSNAFGKSQGTSGGNPLVQMNLVPYSSMSIAGVAFCVQQISFKSGSGGDENDDNGPGGETKAKPGGGDFGFAHAPPGNVSSIQLTLSPSQCTSGESVTMMTKATSTAASVLISSKDQIHLTFKNTHPNQPIIGQVNFNMQNFVNALAPVTSGDQIKPALEGTHGHF